MSHICGDRGVWDEAGSCLNCGHFEYFAQHFFHTRHIPTCKYCILNQQHEQAVKEKLNPKAVDLAKEEVYYGLIGADKLLTQARFYQATVPEKDFDFRIKQVVGQVQDQLVMDMTGLDMLEAEEGPVQSFLESLKTKEDIIAAQKRVIEKREELHKKWEEEREKVPEETEEEKSAKEMQKFSKDLKELTAKLRTMENKFQLDDMKAERDRKTEEFQKQSLKSDFRRTDGKALIDAIKDNLNRNSRDRKVKEMTEKVKASLQDGLKGYVGDPITAETIKSIAETAKAKLPEIDFDRYGSITLKTDIAGDIQLGDNKVPLNQYLKSYNELMNEGFKKTGKEGMQYYPGELSDSNWSNDWVINGTNTSQKYGQAGSTTTPPLNTNKDKDHKDKIIDLVARQIKYAGPSYSHPDFYLQYAKFALPVWSNFEAIEKMVVASIERAQKVPDYKINDRDIADIKAELIKHCQEAGLYPYPAKETIPISLDDKQLVLDKAKLEKLENLLKKDLKKTDDILTDEQLKDKRRKKLESLKIEEFMKRAGIKEVPGSSSKERYEGEFAYTTKVPSLMVLYDPISIFICELTELGIFTDEKDILDHYLKCQGWNEKDFARINKLIKTIKSRKTGSFRVAGLREIRHQINDIDTRINDSKIGEFVATKNNKRIELLLAAFRERFNKFEDYSFEDYRARFEKSERWDEKLLKEIELSFSALDGDLSDLEYGRGLDKIWQLIKKADEEVKMMEELTELPDLSKKPETILREDIDPKGVMARNLATQLKEIGYWESVPDRQYKNCLQWDVSDIEEVAEMVEGFKTRKSINSPSLNQIINRVEENNVMTAKQLKAQEQMEKIMAKNNQGAAKPTEPSPPQETEKEITVKELLQKISGQSNIWLSDADVNHLENWTPLQKKTIMDLLNVKPLMTTGHPYHKALDTAIITTINANTALYQQLKKDKEMASSQQEGIDSEEETALFFTPEEMQDLIEDGDWIDLDQYDIDCLTHWDATQQKTICELLRARDNNYDGNPDAFDRINDLILENIEAYNSGLEAIMKIHQEAREPKALQTNDIPYAIQQYQKNGGKSLRIFSMYGQSVWLTEEENLDWMKFISDPKFGYGTADENVEELHKQIIILRAGKLADTLAEIALQLEHPTFDWYESYRKFLKWDNAEFTTVEDACILYKANRYSANDVFNVANHLDKQSQPQSQFKSELISAGYRVASKQLTTATQTLLYNITPEEKLPLAKSFLTTEIGNGVLSLALGYSLTYGLPESEKAQRLAEEFRVAGITTFGNAAVESLMDMVKSVIIEAVKEIPEENQAVIEELETETSMIEELEMIPEEKRLEN